jgi:hypothetical protein
MEDGVTLTEERLRFFVTVDAIPYKSGPNILPRTHSLKRKHWWYEQSAEVRLQAVAES